MDTNELIKLYKEKEGLKLGYEKYKRKYKLINRILRDGLYYRIEGLKVQNSHILFGINRSGISAEERKYMQELSRFISKEITELDRIYRMCIEVSK